MRLSADEKRQRSAKRREEAARRKRELEWAYLEDGEVEICFDEGECNLQILIRHKGDVPTDRHYLRFNDLWRMSVFLGQFIRRYNYLVRAINEDVENIPPLATLKQKESNDGMVAGQ